jgi:hypothetical protein
VFTIPPSSSKIGGYRRDGFGVKIEESKSFGSGLSSVVNINGIHLLTLSWDRLTKGIKILLSKDSVKA